MQPLIKHHLITWARERQQLSLAVAAKKLGVTVDKLQDWEKGDTFPTFKQVQKIAKKFYVPLGYLFLDEPPVLQLPIPDFRTPNNEHLSHYSSELLAVIHDAQIKQTWLSEIREEEGVQPIFKHPMQIDKVVPLINKMLNIEVLRDSASNYENFLQGMIDALDQKGFMVIRNGVVGNNTHRPLDPCEFRGFALYDEYAPLIFINCKDTKAGQIFTLVHELAHLYLGESGLDGDFSVHTERQCNQIAAEVLVPKHTFKERYRKGEEDSVATFFKVSRFVILIRAKQLGLIEPSYFAESWQAYVDELGLVASNRNSSGGGNFYHSVKFKVGGEKFLHTVINYTLAGKMLYRDAYRLTGLKDNTLHKYYEQVVVR